jgi:diguanylate cyclase (GGDEF)-like protein
MAEATHTQTYVTPVEALGVALDADGLFPVAFAVLHLEFDEGRDVVVDARYVYASRQYCRIISRDFEGVPGRSCREVEAGDVDAWLQDCRKVVLTGETVRGFGYDDLVRDWICYSISPSAQEDCCVYSVMPLPIDEQRGMQLMSSAYARTTSFISDMLSSLSAEQDYEAAMNGMLQMMSTIIHADRLSVFECFGSETKTTFELCAPGVEPQLGAVFGLPTNVLSYWFHNLLQDNVMMVPDISVIQRMSPALYEWCVDSDVQSLMAAPFFNDGQIVGFFGAYNYQIDETIDLNRLFGAVATFIAARIENRQLIATLERASSHDALTGLFNRRGAQAQIDARLEADPQASRVLVLVDVDDFKRVNDVFGHGAGDEALRSIARTLEETFPADEAVISRNGGDEFLVFLSGDSAARASMLLAALTEQGVSYEYEGSQHHVTLSVGYARYPEQTQDLRELSHKADVALYAVKQTGKAGFGKYVPETEGRLRPQLGFSVHDLLGSFPYPALVCRAGGSYEPLFASTDLAQLLGYMDTYGLMRAAREEPLALVHPDERERVAGLLAQMVTGGADAPTEFSTRVLTRDGKALTLRVTGRSVDIEESGSVLYLLLAKL